MFKKASDSKNEKLSIVVFGEPNAGKTSLARTIKEKAIIVDAEGGLQSINDLETDTFRLYENTEGSEVPRHERFDRLVKFMNYLKTDDGKKNQFKWVIIDSLTEVSQNLLEQVKYEEDQKKKAGEKINSFEKWTNYKDRMESFVKDIRDMKGYNILALALVDESKNEDGSKDKRVDIEGKISQRIPAIFDEVMYLHRDNEGKRVLVTDNYKNIVCKDRSGKLDQFEPADIDLISKKIRG